MKLEFIKETRVDGSVIYFTEKNGSYVSNSLSHDEEKGKEFFENIKNAIPKKEVIEIYDTEPVKETVVEEQPTGEWITNRFPTVLDANGRHEVEVLEDGVVKRMPYHLVYENEPWRPLNK
jgi:hypothetical protein